MVSANRLGIEQILDAIAGHNTGSKAEKGKADSLRTSLLENIWIMPEWLISGTQVKPFGWNISPLKIFTSSGLKSAQFSIPDAHPRFFIGIDEVSTMKSICIYIGVILLVAEEA